jgi:hypothetical protein
LSYHTKTTSRKRRARDMDIKSIIETIDSFFGPIARIIGYVTVTGGAIYGVFRFIKNITGNMKKKKKKEPPLLL